MPRSLAAATSTAALNGPVEAIIFRRGKRSMTLRGNGVRSRITHTTSNGAKRSTTASGSATWSLKVVISARAATDDQSAMLSATFW
ncbi:hypothetical protein MBRA_49370 [Mycobacterium branderi]|uniref:Secreted protein n=1 Tax=Mycobacterium branderi TaxID=43348 RepID=A0ABM7KUU2_9MYCO|nr:hypothetical protein MBRA_49370 [Mycobacterium branderi]